MAFQNESIWVIFLLLALSTVLLLFRFFGKMGLYMVIVYSIILCNIQVLKQVNLFGLGATLGNILYASIFLATDMLGEFYGKKDAQRGVLIGFLVTIIMVVYMQIALQFEPNEYDQAQPHFQAIFGLLPSVMAASMLAYLFSQFHDVFMYEKLKRRFNNRHLWLRNNVSTILSQLIDSFVFVTVAFALGAWGDMPLAVAVSIFLTTYLIKVVVAIMDTPFVYMARAFRPTREP